MDMPPLWPAHLHHICLDTRRIEDVIVWYQRNMEMVAEPLADDSVWLTGRQRNLLFRRASAAGLGFMAYAVDDAAQLARLDAAMTDKDAPRAETQTPLFGDGQVALADPDGNTIIFGLPSKPESRDAGALPARLQHMGLCTTDIDQLCAFYVDTVGFKLSDIVKKDNGVTAALFLRSDPEHHDLALFAASSSRFDHMCHETMSWNDIRDWGDHFAERRTEIVWGAGRHGAGNNLFIFVQDPDGNMVELSAELETRTFEAPPDTWRAEPRTLNLWGKAWTRT